MKRIFQTDDKKHSAKCLTFADFDKTPLALSFCRGIGIGKRISKERTAHDIFDVLLPDGHLLFSGKKSKQKCLCCCPLSRRYGTFLR